MLQAPARCAMRWTARTRRRSKWPAATLPGCWCNCCGPPARPRRRSPRWRGSRCPAAAAAALAQLLEVATLLSEQAPELALTVDPIEWRGFEYHTGTGFSLFAGGVRTELGRGGRYSVGDAGAEEEAAGCTIYVDTVLRAAPAPPAPRRVYLPHGTPRSDGAGLRDAGWVTIAGLALEGDPAAEAARLGCSHLWQGGTARAVGGED